MADIRLNRRSFLYASGAFVSCFAIGGIAYATGQNKVLLRPPGGQDHGALLSSCIKCDRCRSACPKNVIDLASLEDGVINARSPKLSFRKGFCDFCENYNGFKCVDACPTGAINASFDLASDKIGMAKLDTTECLLYRMGSHICPRPCIGICKFDALKYDEKSNQITVVPENCNGCGACEYVCVSATYGSYTGSFSRGINIETWNTDLK
jgi:ferredoxin-type protein NapG